MRRRLTAAILTAAIAPSTAAFAAPRDQTYSQTFYHAAEELGAALSRSLRRHGPRRRHRMLSAPASEYGQGDNQMGGPLACGGRLRPDTPGVANKSLPCGTLLRVCVNRCVRVRVIDRGPYSGDREFDLTVRTARDVRTRYPWTGTLRWRVVG